MVIAADEIGVYRPDTTLDEDEVYRALLAARRKRAGSGDPAFRAWVWSHGLISDGADPVLMAVPSTTAAEVLSMLDDVADHPPVRQIWLAVADGSEPHGFRLVRIGGTS